MVSRSKIIWTLKELTTCIRQRQLNKYDANVGVSGKRGDGKTQVKGDIVLMSDGSYKKVEDIKIGDEIISPQKDGSFTYEKIIHIHSRFEKEIYDICEVTRKKKVLYSCAWNHELPIIKRYSKRTSKDDSTPRIIYRYLSRFNAKELSKKYCKCSYYSSFTTPLIEFKDNKDLDIEPYCLGVLLGDGSFTDSLNITSDDIEIMEEVSKHYPIMSIYKKQKTNAKMYRFSICGEFSKKLIKLGLRYKKSHNKFIPKEFLKTSKEFRLNLLAGLIDTDGFISKNNQITICTKSVRLAENIKDLVFSLGGYSLIRNIYKKSQTMKEKRLYYDISIQFKNPHIIPLRVKRKKERLRIRKIDPTHIAVKSVKRKKGSMVYGFSITGKSKWYITNNYMVTHNSTLLFKVFNSFKKEGFNPEKHQEYSRDKIINLLANQQFGFCWDDEAINSGYKRDFQHKGQKDMIKILTNYRDNFNIIGSAIPFFYSLDRDLRELLFLHIHIVERGVAILLMPLGASIHSTDPWDTKINIKIEQQENTRLKRSPNAKFRYHRFTTFAGYLYFGPMTPKQEKKYLEIKKRKRAVSLNVEGVEEQLDFNQKIYNALIEGKVTQEALQTMCHMEGKKYSSVTTILNIMLRDNGVGKTVGDFLIKKQQKVLPNKNRGQIDDLLPDF